MKSCFNAQNLIDSMVKMLSRLKYYPNKVTEGRKILHIINIYRKSRQVLDRTDTDTTCACTFKEFISRQKSCFSHETKNYAHDRLYHDTIWSCQSKLHLLTSLSIQPIRREMGLCSKSFSALIITHGRSWWSCPEYTNHIQHQLCIIH